MSLATRIGQDAARICGTAPRSVPAGSYTSLASGYWRDYSQPAGVYHYYYFNAYACANSRTVRYFPDVGKCVSITPVSTPTPSNPKGLGPSCPANPQDKQPSCGNPISPGNGTKVQQEVDALSNTPGLRLDLVRTYNGGAFAGNLGSTGVFGSRWSSVLDRKVTIRASQTPMECFIRSSDKLHFCEQSLSDANGQSAVVARPDGKAYTFNRSGNQWLAEADVNDRLEAQYAADGVTPSGWTLTTASQDVEQYDANGRLISVTSRTGTSHRFTYSSGTTNDTASARLPEDAPACGNIQAGAVMPAGLAVCVTDNWGRQLQFEYDGKQRVIKAIDPAGQQYQYKYDGESGGCLASDPGSPACRANNLTEVVYPGNKTRKYHYNEQSLIGGGYCSGASNSGNGFAHLVNTMTGITDENGIRFATWGWDCNNRAISSEHAGGVDKVTITHGNRASDGSNAVSVTSHVGTAAAPATIVRTYNFKVSLGVSKVNSLNQPCEGCDGMQERTHDANNNVLSSKDWLGSKTVYAYDTGRNLETSRTEAHGTTLARTITTAWHPTMRLRSAVAEPLRVTSYTYDGNGNQLSKTVQATADSNGSQGFSAAVVGTPRTWNTTYNEFGQMLTMAGPGITVAMTYDSHGNLSTVTNAAGHVTTYSNYDMNGRAGRVTDANGLATDYVYGARGWLDSTSVGGEVTSYTYDGVGNLKTATLSDHSSLTYHYDSARRMTGITDSYGNNISYTLDRAGNRIDEQVRDASGTLTRKISRVFDTLNRLQQITGAQE